MGSLMGLGFLGLVFVPVALAIKLDDPGPIFYSQERYGLQGRIPHKEISLDGCEC